MSLDAVELEIKLAAATESVWSELFGLPMIAKATIDGTVAEKALESHYFDTESRRLAQAGYAYRIRRTPSGFVATMKGFGHMEGGLAHRPEFEAPVPDLSPDLSVFDGQAVGADLTALLAGEPLTRLFTVDVVRRQRQLQLTPQTRVEMAVDFGRILAGGKESPLAEVEFELMEGTVADLLRFVADLCARLPFYIAFKSKFRRGLDLLADVREPEDRPAPVALAEDKAVGAAAYGLLAGAVGALLQQQQRLGQGNEAALDEMRLFGSQLQLLRCLLAFAKPLLEPADYARQQLLLGRLAEPFAELDQVEALAADWGQLSCLPGAISGSTWIGKQLEARREQLGQRILREKQSGAYTQVLTALWAWAAASPWGGSDARLASDYAAARIAKWMMDLLQMGEGAADDPATASRLFGQGQKIAVVVACLGPAFADAEQKAFDRLQSLQKRLQSVWLAETGKAVLQSFLGAGASRLLYRDAGLLAGWRLRTVAEALRQVDKRWRRFAKPARKWIKHVR